MTAALLSDVSALRRLGGWCAEDDFDNDGTKCKGGTPFNLGTSAHPDCGWSPLWIHDTCYWYPGLNESGRHAVGRPFCPLFRLCDDRIRGDE